MNTHGHFQKEQVVSGEAPKKPSPASIVGMAILVGAIFLSITDSLVGGLSGGDGFIIGFGAAYLFLYVFAWLRFQSEYNNHTFQDNTQEFICPNCQISLTVTPSKSKRENKNLTE